MQSESIPVLWDEGRVSLTRVDERGILRLRPASDGEAERALEALELVKGALKMPTLALPMVHAPGLSPIEAQLLLNEIAWHHK